MNPDKQAKVVIIGTPIQAYGQNNYSIFIPEQWDSKRTEIQNEIKTLNLLNSKESPKEVDKPVKTDKQESPKEGKWSQTG